MKKIFTILTLSLVVAILAVSLLPASPAVARSSGRVVVANRASGTISVIDALTDELLGTYDLPMMAGDAMPEPMYVVYSAAKDRMFVGDRANDRIVVYDARDLSVEALVPAGQGVYHMWADPQGKQLWVNNDIDNTSTVIDPNTLQVIATVPTPADLIAMGGRPHDMMVGPQGRYAYVTVLGLPGDHDYVVQFSTETFMEVARAEVGKDPHLALFRQNPFLYVASQGSNQVRVLDRETLAWIADIDVPGAHGAGMPRNGRYFYTTNLPGGGTDALYTIDTQTNTVVGAPVDTPYAVPHNLVLTPDSQKMFVTHSGPNTTVTIFAIAGDDPTPAYAGEVTVGANPFGLTYIP
ncbi:MAG: beta-propeller fold lactonase family protein [Anaerolineae bacterium]|jgi:YVTN family beta-propeller protein